MSEVRLSPDALALSREVATLRKGLENMKMQGEAAVELIQSGSVQPMRAAAPSHLGNLVDFYA